MALIVPTRLKIAREEKGYTIENVALNIGIKLQLIINYENGISDPDLESIKIFAKMYEVTTDFLLGFVDNSHDYVLTSITPDSWTPQLVSLVRDVKKKIDKQNKRSISKDGNKI